ncbi:amino acid permease [Staphylococcus gallinarum]|uniref:Amino acid permease n=1 Tax=Staphylococcus gallinarum TaxID=1293 RepID=A0A2T4SX58_STAGA|nr:amino acid permease [Staphylococcus gallinarum]MCD8820728.1 amino acid permease [Staphylococcus gallinarum]MCD8826353.1 amino acid permease [Staphylococcus gallinarum]MCD8871492.1 amino acid permease [Staphylococcus gallinarum]MCD8899507.1 amino acid permease [Staphylococcus gallinarum]MCD8903024.1 amino acid permease [Staphylococcus gallinarum]
MSDHLQRGLSNRHIQLIAIGGAIGTGLFLGSGQTISLTGSSIIFTYLIIGVVLFMFMRGLGELLLSNSRYKSFVDIANDQLGPYAGFLIGWTYWMSWITSSMSDLTAMGSYVSYWSSNIPNWLTILFIVLLLMAFNSLGSNLFGEIEFWFSMIKIITIIVLIVVGLAFIILGFKTNHSTASFTNLYDNGVFTHGAYGFLMSFQMAVYSFIGIELIGVTAGETKNPNVSIPRAVNSVPIRILLFYIGSLIVIMSITPWDHISADKSPFVQVFALIGIPFAASAINFVVLTAAASATNSGIFSDSRMLFGLAQDKQAPAIMGKTNKHGVPHIAMFISTSILLVAVMLNYIFPNTIQLFIYITTISTVLYLLVWILIIVSYIKYAYTHKEEHKQNVFKLKGGFLSGYAVLAFFFFVFVLLFFSDDTRRAVYFLPIWLLATALMYLKIKRKKEQSNQENLNKETALTDK